MNAQSQTQYFAAAKADSVAAGSLMAALQAIRKPERLRLAEDALRSAREERTERAVQNRTVCQNARDRENGVTGADVEKSERGLREADARITARRAEVEKMRRAFAPEFAESIRPASEALQAELTLLVDRLATLARDSAAAAHYCACSGLAAPPPATKSETLLWLTAELSALVAHGT